MTFQSNYKFEWSNAREVELIRLVIEERLSFTAIAEVIGAPSRNVPLCKWNRLTKLNPTLVHPNAKAAPPKRLKIRSPSIPLPPTPVVLSSIEPLLVDGKPVLFVDAKHGQCRYPYGDPLDENFHICAHPAKDDHSYCAAHYSKCYNKPKPYKGASSGRFTHHSGRNWSPNEVSSRVSHDANPDFWFDSEH